MTIIALTEVMSAEDILRLPNDNEMRPEASQLSLRESTYANQNISSATLVLLTDFRFVLLLLFF